jgi:hypothetical protein
MFQRSISVHVSAPTGPAAFNIGGETIHRSYIKVNENYQKKGNFKIIWLLPHFMKEI